MEEKREEQMSSADHGRWLVGLVVLLLIAAVIGFGYAFYQQRTVGDLRAQEQEMSATLGQVRGQLDAVTSKLAAMTTPATAESTPGAEGQATPATTRAGSKRRVREDRRLKQIQAELAQHKKQLDATQQEVEQARTDLEGRLSSTRDELNGSIARTHDELVALEKRGERNFYEFDLTRSKNFQRVGPISLSLRKADTKHQSYDMMLLVDDFRLSKKKVNLYEPVWFHRSDYPQPLQLVINRIDQNHVRGYVSEPKYKLSELAANTPPANPVSGEQTQPASAQQPQSETQQPPQQPLPPPEPPQ